MALSAVSFVPDSAKMVRFLEKTSHIFRACPIVYVDPVTSGIGSGLEWEIVDVNLAERGSKICHT